jgi:hypothetical protein
MPVTRSQKAEMTVAAKTLLTLKNAARPTPVAQRPTRKAALLARQLIKLCASSDNEDYSQ